MGGGLNAIGQGESSENQGTAIERYCNRKVLQSKGCCERQGMRLQPEKFLEITAAADADSLGFSV
jgi:hypothetical protein